jgi:hypothetical protein
MLGEASKGDRHFYGSQNALTDLGAGTDTIIKGTDWGTDTLNEGLNERDRHSLGVGGGASKGDGHSEQGATDRKGTDTFLGVKTPSPTSERGQTPFRTRGQTRSGRETRGQTL